MKVKTVTMAFAVTLLVGSFCTAADDPCKFLPLFDGKTLDGWKPRGGDAEYRVEDGTIVGSSVPKTPNSFLCT